MVKMNVKREGAKLKPSRIAENKQITDTQHVYFMYFFPNIICWIFNIIIIDIHVQLLSVVC